MRYMPACPHQRGIWLGSVIAWNTRSGGAATKISASMVSWSGVTATVAIARSFLFLHKLLEVLQDTGPSPGVVLARDGQLSQAAVRDAHERASLARRQFPADDSALRRAIVPIR